MAKGLRSKIKKRMRTVRREHYWEIEGKQKLQDVSAKLHDPTYDFKEDGTLPANAYLEPNNPKAVFPQHARPHILDFRAHKIAGSGFASKYNNRKMMTEKSTKSKYTTIVKTAKEIEEELLQAQIEADQKQASDDEIDIADIQKDTTVDELTASMKKQMKLSKKKAKDAEVPMELESKPINKHGSKIAKLKQKSKGKRSRSQLKF